MPDVVRMPAMDEAQKQSWHALMELYEHLDSGWTLIGGQLVHLHCAERGAIPSRPTNDVDTVVDIRMSQSALADFTRALKVMSFTPEISGSGMQHRWRRDEAQMDVLIPEGVGALVGKAAAGTEIGSGQGGSRHLADFLVLAGLVSARDFRMVHLEKKDRRRLSRMLDRCRDDGVAMSTDGAGEALDRLHRAAKLGS